MSENQVRALGAPTQPKSDPPAKDALRFQNGHFKMSISYAAIALVVGAAGTYFATHSKPPDTPQTSASYADVLNKQISSDSSRQAAENAQAIINSAMLARLNTLDTKLGVLEAQNTAILLAVRNQR